MVTMKKEPRTLWSGVLFLFVLGSAGMFSVTVGLEYYEWLLAHRIVFGLLVTVWNVTMIGILFFPLLLILTYFIEGIKVLRKEGVRPANFLSLVFAVLLCVYLIGWPFLGDLSTKRLANFFYLLVSFAVIYLLLLMAMYTLSAFVNLVHIRKKRNLDYIVVLGCGIRGETVTPLLAGRINKGIALLKYNPKAKIPCADPCKAVQDPLCRLRSENEMVFYTQCCAAGVYRLFKPYLETACGGGYSCGSSYADRAHFLTRNESLDFFNKLISTHLLTVLTTGAILQTVRRNQT